MSDAWGVPQEKWGEKRASEAAGTAPDIEAMAMECAEECMVSAYGYYNGGSAGATEAIKYAEAHKDLPGMHHVTHDRFYPKILRALSRLREADMKEIERLKLIIRRDPDMNEMEQLQSQLATMTKERDVLLKKIAKYLQAGGVLTDLLKRWVEGGECFCCSEGVAARAPCEYCLTKSLLTKGDALIDDYLQAFQANLGEVRNERDTLRSHVAELEKERDELTEKCKAWDAIDVMNIESIDGWIDRCKQLTTERDSLAALVKAKDEALLRAHPAKTWDIARQAYTGPNREPGENIRAWHHDNCKAVDAALALTPGTVLRQFVRREVTERLVSACEEYIAERLMEADLIAATKAARAELGGTK